MGADCRCLFKQTAPDVIPDVFSSVLGDGFHFMDRPKVPIHHANKKGYFHALQEAWYAWDPEVLLAVQAVLLSKGMTQKEIDDKMYYDVAYFRARVPRLVLPASKLYWRVRAVYELYGNMLDSETKKPLFNKTNWARARNVLQDILAGYASDPPGFEFYTYRLNKCGEQQLDADGLHLITCNRGTNDTENFHKQVITAFGTWTTGVEMADRLLAERRHRYNHNVSERRRLGFPKIGHYDTWRIDSLQTLVEHNHSVLLYPEWSNASDYKYTTETFGTVSLHSAELAEAIEKIELPTNANKEPATVTPDMKYLCKCMKTKLPLLPVVGEKEFTLFQKLVLKLPSPTDYEAMAIEWCRHVDGVDVWPKLPVYLRTHHTTWLRNQRVKDAVTNAASGEEKLKKLNADTMPLCSHRAALLTHAQPLATPLAALTGAAAQTLQSAAPRRPLVHLPLPLQHCFVPPTWGYVPPVVGGFFIGGAPVTTAAPKVPSKRKAGQRGGDTKKRAPNTCRRCKSQGSPDAHKCPGSNSHGKCLHYSCAVCKHQKSCKCATVQCVSVHAPVGGRAPAVVAGAVSAQDT